MRIVLAAVIATLFMSPVIANDGEQVFDDACASCHTGGIGGWMSGAPDIDDKEDWQPIIMKGVDALTLGTIEGIGEMPPRGKCATCSDEQIRAAVEYMVEVLSD